MNAETNSIIVDGLSPRVQPEDRAINNNNFQDNRAITIIDPIRLADTCACSLAPTTKWQRGSYIAMDSFPIIS